MGKRVRGPWRRCVSRERFTNTEQRLRDPKADKTNRRSGDGKHTAEKFPGLLETRPCVRFRFLKEHQDEFRPIKKACKILRISKAGYYEYSRRRKSNQQIEREALEGFVADIFEKHKSRYGARRVKRELEGQNIRVSEKRVGKVMRKLGLVAKGTTRRYRTQK